MKIKFLLAVTAILCFLGVSSLYAQFKAGAGLLYGTEIDQIGLQINGYYDLPAVENLSVGGDLSFYLPHKFSGYKESMWELNINGHYSAYKQDNIDLYGLAGINITGWKVKYTGDPGYGRATYSTSRGGINIGGGIQTNVGFGSIYGEVKYAIVSDLGHLALGGGVRLPF